MIEDRTVNATLPVAEYIEQFTKLAEDLANTKLQDAPKVEVITSQVNALIEEYYSKVGKFPKSYVLELLANYILINELKNKDVDKVANNEFPILSEVQIKRRNRKQVSMQDETIDFLNTKLNKQIDSLAKKTVKKAEY